MRLKTPDRPAFQRAFRAALLLAAPKVMHDWNAVLSFAAKLG